MFCSGGKAVIRFIASQSASLWASSLLMRRDAALTGVRSLSLPQRLRLRTTPLLGSSFLFPESVIQEMGEEKQAKRDASLFSNVAKLTDSAQKVVQKQAASSVASASASSGYKKGKKKPAPAQPKAQGEPAQAPSSSNGSSFQGRRPKRTFPGRGLHQGGKGKGKGRGGR